MPDLKESFDNNGMVVPDEYQDFDSAAVFASAVKKANDISALDNFKAGLDSEEPLLGLIVTTGDNGTVSHDQPQDYAQKGSSVTVTAVPDPLYMFDKWIGPVEDEYNPNLTFTIQENTYLKATFRLQI